MANQEDLLDRKETLRAPAVSSVILHLAVAGTFIGLAFVSGLFKHATWGDTTAGGAISATLVSSASLPLPQDHPPTDSVLATERPSPETAPPQPKAIQQPDDTAIPIATKQDKAKKAPEKSEEKTQAPPKPIPPGKQTPQKQDNRAQYGEGSPNMARSTAGGANGNGNPVAASGDFGSRFGWYVDIIKRKVSESWYKAEVDPSTGEGKEAVITFMLSRDGSPSSIRIVTSSGSSTLDSSAIRAVQRVDTFGPLPPGYTGSNLNVAYTFSYTHPNH